MKKYVLGINGWFEGSHDASAILVEFDQENPARIVAGLEEEKVIGKKGLFDVFPINAVKDVMKISGIKTSDLCAVAIGWDYPLVYKSMNKKFNFTSDKIFSHLFPEEEFMNIPILYVNHHLSHANSAHYASSFSKSLSLVIDGNGELEASSLWLYDNTERRLLESFNPVASFGFLFEATNTMLGFRENESGKTMGLAGYGKPKYVSQLLNYFGSDLSPSNELEKLYEKFKSTNNTDLLMPYQEICIKMWRYIFEYRLGIEPLKYKENSFYDFPDELKDLASSVQKVLEVKILNYIKQKVTDLNIYNITISGGVGLNCILNGKILEINDVRNIFVQPASGDTGVALGAAIEYGYMNNYNCKIEDFSSYIGKEFSDEEIEKYLISNSISFIKVKDASMELSKYLKLNEIVAIFQGRNEWGPRALGNRTILSLPSEGKLDFINKHVKCRELGRPLAPSMIISDLDQLIENRPKTFGKYMNIAHKASKLKEENLSIIHVDHTFRPQCVFKKDNPNFYNQLEKIKEEVGSSILINTSFNADTPIIYNLNSAIDFMKTRYIDKIIFNNKFIVSRG